MEIDPEIISSLEHHVGVSVRSGYESESEIVEQSVDLFSDELQPEILRGVVAKMTRRAIEAHLRAEMSWPDVTDCDRLAAAFAELENAGIVSRQNFSCCGSCGADEIWDEIEAAPGSTGYAFFHQQDTESAAEGHGLYLSYGSVGENEESALAVAKKIVETLERHGLVPDWNGEWSMRIAVPMDWKRRYRR